MKTLLVFSAFCVLLCSFSSQPDPDSLLKSGQKNAQNKEYIKAIQDYTLAISIKPDFGEAYLHRALAKMNLVRGASSTNYEYCLDLTEALRLGQLEAAPHLKESCGGQCFGTHNAFIEPDLVLCADFSSSILAELPEGSGKLYNLIKLNMFNNRLKSLDPDFSSFSSLLILDLSSNQLQELGPMLGYLKNLDELNLNKNQLSILPEEIGSLERVKKISIRSNRLASLPTTIGKCRNLEELDLSSNNLQTLPVEIGELVNLKTLNLSGNFFDKKTQKSIQRLLPHTQVFF